MGLPRELRDHIYSFALISEQPISVLNFVEQNERSENASKQEKLLPPQRHGLSPSILRTCHQVYNEATSLLYGHNTFHAVVKLHLHHALRRIEVINALVVPPEADPPEPETVCKEFRPIYTHGNIKLIRRLEIEIKQLSPAGPHWMEGELRVDQTMSDLCNYFIEGNCLPLLTVRSHGCLPLESWLPASGDDLHFAKCMETLMWQYHEWHIERAMLAATRSCDVLWLRSDEQHDRISLEGSSVFFPSIRDLSIRERMSSHRKVHFMRTAPARFHGLVVGSMTACDVDN